MGWNKTSQVKISAQQATQAKEGQYDENGTTVQFSVFLHYSEFKKLQALIFVHGTRSASMEIANMVKRSYSAIAPNHGLKSAFSPTIADLETLKRGENVKNEDQEENNDEEEN